MTAPSTDSPERLVPVWDIWVRLFHWSLAASVATAAATGFLGDARWLAVHLGAGLAAAGLVLGRIVWGVLGPTHARFADFVPRPGAVIAHLRGAGPRHLGHNPPGALMVLALLAAVLGLAATGLAALGGWLRSGPFAADLGTGAGQAAGAAHEILALAVAAMVALHLGGVLHASRHKRENLLRAMLTGRKPARPGDAPARSARPQGRRALTVLAGLAAGLALAAAALSARAVPGLPARPVAPVVAQECGACHMVFHPSLLPAAAWRAVMAGLDDHFGESAALAPATAAGIKAWLTAHAAETVDTAPARLFAAADPAAPAALTRTPGWQRIHAGLPGALFARAPIRSRANCLACHGDAETGRFSPFAIAIPKETTR